MKELWRIDRKKKRKEEEQLRMILSGEVGAAVLSGVLLGGWWVKRLSCLVELSSYCVLLLIVIIFVLGPQLAMGDPRLLFKGHSSRLQLLIEKIQANKENHNVTEQDIKDVLGTERGSSWSSEGQSSPPSSCATPNSVTELPDSELTFTVGVTNATPYPCQFCDKAFPRLSYLKRHEQTHSDHLPFICEFCKRRFKHKRSKDRHLKLHTGDKRYKCSQCQAAFARSDHLKIHMKTHDNQKPFQCTVCNRGYNTAAALTSHMQNHKKTETENPSPGNCFKCLECTEFFAEPDQLTNHMRIEHRSGSSKRHISPMKSKLTCLFCTKDNFTSLPDLGIHMKVMHGTSLNGDQFEHSTANAFSENCLTSQCISCRHCTMVFPSLDLLHIHSAAAHEGTTTSKDLYCAQCDLSFTSIHAFSDHYFFSLHNHLKTEEHSSSSPVVAIPSSSDQLTPTDLSVVKKDKDDNKPPPVKRPRSMAAPTESHRQAQVVQYEHPGILFCNQCNAALPDFESFRSHLKSHLDESAHPPSQPAFKQSLQSTYFCSQCGACCNSSEELTRHINTHLCPITEYVCHKCCRLFVKSDDLKKHFMENHLHHVYKCTLCKELFESKNAIMAHFATTHCEASRQFRCKSCPNKPPFQSECEFKVHAQMYHGAPGPFSMISPGTPPLVPSPGIFRCIFCSLTFNSEIEMHMHLSLHPKQLQCHFCPEAFNVEYLLEKHMQINHPTQTNLLCSTQDKSRETDRKPSNGFHVNSVNQPQQHIQHSNISNGNNPAENKRLEYSQLVNNNNNNNTSHPGNKANVNNNNNNNNNMVICDLCECSDFSSEAELNAHRKLVHHLKSSCVTKVSLHCAYCKENCKSRNELENHMKSHCQAAVISGSKHKCNICDEIFISAAILAEHKLTHCKVIYGSTCTHCKSPVTTEDDYIGHVLQHNNNAANSGGNSHQLVLPVTCVICRQTLSSELEMRLHAKFHLKMDATKCTQCLEDVERGEMNDGLCSACFNRNNNSSLKCPQCLLKFEALSTLENHMESVHKKCFQCKQCKTIVENESEYELHVASHTSGESGFKCNICMFVLPDPRQLQAHLIEHTFAGCSNYTCYICSSVFTTAVGLQTHILNHNLTAKPYDCSKCSMQFYFRAELDNHFYLHIEAASASKIKDIDSKFNPPYHLQSPNNESEDRRVADVNMSAKKSATSKNMFQPQLSIMSLNFNNTETTGQDNGVDVKGFKGTEGESS